MSVETAANDAAGAGGGAEARPSATARAAALVLRSGYQVALVALAAMFFVAALLVFAKIVTVQQEVRADVRENAVWAAYQLEREIGRFQEAVHAKRDAPTTRAAAEMRLRFDILYSRIDLLGRPEFTAAYTGADEAPLLIRSLRQAVEGIARELDANPGPRDLSAPALLSLEARSGAMRREAERLLLDVNQASNDRRVAEREYLLRLYTVLGALVALMTAAMLALIVQVIRTMGEVAASRSKLAALADRLRETADLAEEASRAKSTFLANMSHEIRTPLNGVIGTAEILLSGELTPEQRRLVSASRTSGMTLLALIDDVLDLSRLEADAVVLEAAPFDPLAEAEATVAIVESRARANGIVVVLAPALRPGRRFVGDAVRFRQVLLNLVSNAVKFTLAGAVVVRLGEARGEDGRPRLAVEVADTGIGIPERHRDRLFQSFSQLDRSITRRFGGTGLGLAISRRMVELMDGSIGFETEEGRGTVFRVVLPLPPAADGPAPPAPLAGLAVAVHGRTTLEADALAGLVRHLGGRVDASADAGIRAIVDPAHPDRATLEIRTGKGPARRTAVVSPAAFAEPGPAERVERSAAGRLEILVAEDDETSREVARILLERAGHAVTVVETGAEAVAAIAARRFDLVLLDLSMPVMDGLSAARAIRSAEAGGRRTPIIAVTANAFASDRRACLEAGMDGFVPKPVTWASIRAALDGAAPPAPRPHSDDRLSELVSELGAPAVDRLGEAFVRESEALVEKAMAAHRRGDLAEAAHFMHALKGAAANLGFEGLAAAAAALQHDPDGLPDARERLARGLAASRERLGLLAKAG